jgi:class 3 adenylate cyclase
MNRGGQSAAGADKRPLVGPGDSEQVHSQEPLLLEATILFVDLMGSVAISNHLTVWEYNTLINEYQNELRKVIDQIRQSYPVGEYYIGGDQLAVFFYDPADIAVYLQIDRLRSSGADEAEIAPLVEKMEFAQKRALYGALRCAIAIKNSWIGHTRNIVRVNSQQPMLDVGIGINTGQVVYQRRGDGLDRIEGYTINFAKRVEGYARHGRFCKIMFSKRSYELFRQTVVRHVMMKQRAAFEAYEPQPGMLKGLAPGTKVYELKFFHRLAGIGIPEQQVDLFNQIFLHDPTNLWAYVNLVNYYLHVSNDTNSALEVSRRALYSNPQNEKIYYDLALTTYMRGDYETSREYCARCIRLNDEMDMAYDLMGDIMRQLGDSPEQVLSWRRQALSLAPESAGYTMEVALALALLGQYEQAGRYYSRAVRLFPQLAEAFPDECERLEALLV